MSDKDAMNVRDMLDLREIARRGACEPVNMWLVRRAKKLWPWWAGYQFFLKTDVPRKWLLISRHHPAQLCWSWHLSVEIFPRRRGIPIFQPYSGGRASISIPRLIEFSFVRQSYDSMLSTAARLKLAEIAKDVAPINWSEFDG